MRRLIYIILGVLVIATVYQCNQERIYTTDPDAMLEFSMDTVYFDTVFTTVGSTTHSFRIYNKHNRFLKIDDISLAGGEGSVFRINLDGMSGNHFTNFEIAPDDSMYVFVEVTLDPNDSQDILRIQDSITFLVNGNLQDVDLVAWGQDVHMIRDSIIDVSATWTNDKPYLIVGYLFVDTLQTLIIEPGVKIHLHRDAWIGALGTLKILGEEDEEVVIQGDRLEYDYRDIPGQWYGIFLFNGSTDNEIQYTKVLNGTFGLFVNSPVSTGEPALKISNTEINQMAYDGILAQGSSIDANNLVVGNCGNSCMEIFYEGSYLFTHCTFANFYPTWAGKRKNPALIIANYVVDTAKNIYPGNIEMATFRNSIIYGDRGNELIISKAESDEVLNYTFDHCLMKIDTEELNYFIDPNFTAIINNKNPLFDTVPVSYALDSLSPAINKGLMDYAIDFPLDKAGNYRTEDTPDLGAYEWKGSGGR